MTHSIKISKLILLFALLNIFRLTAQDSELSSYMPNYATAGMGNLYNGQPDISMPLYTLKARGVSVPVSLSYDASGIKVHQEATSVGLGWVLNAGGHIIQEVRDEYDFVGIPRVTKQEDAGDKIWYTSNGTPDPDYERHYPYQFDGHYLDNKYDNLPDIFYYSFNGLSGKYILGKDLQTGISLPESTLKIKHNNDSPFISSITITTDNGVQYNFGAGRAMPIESLDYRDTKSVIYLLTSIYTPQFDTIEFSYKQFVYYKSEMSSIFENITNEYYQSITRKQVPLFLPKKISVRGGESVEFEFGNGRLDAKTEHYTVADSVPSIKRVKLLDANGNTKKYFELYYSYFKSDPYLQYLPHSRSDGAGHLLGEYTLKQGDVYKTYTNIEYYDDGPYIFPPDNTPENFKKDVYGYCNGVLEKIENHYRIGNYIFTEKNGTPYAIINIETQNITLPPFPEPSPFKCIEGITNFPCAAQWQDYHNYLSKYYATKDRYYGQTVNQPIHHSNYFDHDMYYYAVDPDIMNTFYEFYLRVKETDFGFWPEFRPFYKSDYSEYFNSHISLRLKLDSIKETATGQPQYFTTKFEYNPTKLPCIYTTDFDHWGYYNYREGKHNVTPVPRSDDRGPASVFNVRYRDTTGRWSNEALYTGYRLANEEKMNACILQKIIYPGGSYIKYNYEANRARTNSSGTEAAIVGGLRLNSTETGTVDGQKYFTKYDYKIYNDAVVNNVYTLTATNENSGYLHAGEVQYVVGTRIFKEYGGYWKAPRYGLYAGVFGYRQLTGAQILEPDAGEYVSTVDWDKDVIGVMNSVLPLEKTRSGYVGYSQVAVRKEDASGNNLGTELYKFYANSPLEFVSFTETEFGPLNDFFKYLRPAEPSDPLLGTLQEKIVADKNGRILSKTVNTYCLTSPNLFIIPKIEGDLPLPEYSNYIHSYAGEIPGGSYSYLTYLEPNASDGMLSQIAPEVPRLSSVHNYSYFPGGKIYGDSVFYLYDVLLSYFTSTNLETSSSGGFKEEILRYPGYENDPDYNSDLDAIHGEDVDGYQYYGFIPSYTQNILEELKFSRNGDEIRTRYWYAPHFAATDPVCAKMTAKNIISSPVRVEKFLNGKRIEGAKTQYAVFSKEGSTGEDFLLPSESLTYNSNVYEPAIQYTKYNDAGMLTETKNMDGNFSSLIWGYNKSFPVALVENASSNEIFYDSFEERCGWDANLTAYDNTKSHAGSYCGRIDKAGTGELYSHSTKWLSISLTAPKKFKYSGWVYSNGPTAEIFLFMKRAGETAYFSYVDNVYATITGKWVYVEKEFEVPADVTQLSLRIDNNGGGTVWFDDLRLYPANAQMATTTYDPLVGKTSETDANNITTYYEYDRFGRLIRVKDQDGKVLKETQYHYSGQN
jgi:YD repeat-containing protein